MIIRYVLILIIKKLLFLKLYFVNVDIIFGPALNVYATIGANASEICSALPLVILVYGFVHCSWCFSNIYFAEDTDGSGEDWAAWDYSVAYDLQMLTSQ